MDVIEFGGAWGGTKVHEFHFETPFGMVEVKRDIFDMKEIIFPSKLVELTVVSTKVDFFFVTFLSLLIPLIDTSAHPIHDPDQRP